MQLLLDCIMEKQLNDNSKIAQIVEKQRLFFRSKLTLDLKFRLAQLKKLYLFIKRHENEIIDAVGLDFKKSKFETYGTEIALVQEEIKYFLRHLPQLMRPERVKSSLASFPARSYVYKEPYGLSLIIGPWNYPFQLIFSPLVGSLAAGNCVILKPSELAAHTSAIIKKMIGEIFEEDYVCVMEGGPEITAELLAHKFDHICFTGSVRVGKIVYEAAAKNLTPCLLELGGKSPCIVDRDTDLDIAARRIVWGKFLNGGQTCVAPDYVYVHRSIKPQLISKFIHYIKEYYGENPQISPDFPRIINEQNFIRLKNLLYSGAIMTGGTTDASDFYIAPTILDNISWNDEVMQDEIFGPILPVLEFEDIEHALEEIKNRPKPLALYYFSNNKKKQEQILREVGFGGGCINATLFQFGSPNIPIGGVGNSGMGKYHGKYSFSAFSNTKGIVKKITWPDIKFLYAPYKGKMGLLKLIFKL
jgi:aldehyde dehydrogenase (NAD+)